jgi:hypothetical protein
MSKRKPPFRVERSLFRSPIQKRPLEWSKANPEAFWTLSSTDVHEQFYEFVKRVGSNPILGSTSPPALPYAFRVPLQSGYRVQPKKEPYLPVRSFMGAPHCGQTMPEDGAGAPRSNFSFPIRSA